MCGCQGRLKIPHLNFQDVLADASLTGMPTWLQITICWCPHMATYMRISVLGGIFWRRANRWGALAATVAAMATNFAVYAAVGQRLDHWDPNVFLIALSAGVAGFVLVSLATPPARAPDRFPVDDISS